jgi:hypothetical protein
MEVMTTATERFEAANPGDEQDGKHVWRCDCGGLYSGYFEAHKPLYPTRLADGPELDWDRYVYKLPGVEVPDGVRWPECHRPWVSPGNTVWYSSQQGFLQSALYRCPVADWCDDCMRPKGSCGCRKKGQVWAWLECVEKAGKSAENSNKRFDYVPDYRTPIDPVTCEWCGATRPGDRDLPCEFGCGGYRKPEGCEGLEFVPHDDVTDTCFGCSHWNGCGLADAECRGTCVFYCDGRFSGVWINLDTFGSHRTEPDCPTCGGSVVVVFLGRYDDEESEPPVWDCQGCGLRFDPSEIERYKAQSAPSPPRVKQYRLERSINGAGIADGVMGCVVPIGLDEDHWSASDVPCLTDADGRVFSHWIDKDGNAWAGAAPRCSGQFFGNVPAVWPHAAVFVMPEDAT